MVDYQGDELAYYKALANTLKDGVIDQDEYSLLLSLRESFGVSNSLHEQMENEIRASLSSSSPISPSGKLEKLIEMRNAGGVTSEEFEKMKKEILERKPQYSKEPVDVQEEVHGDDRVEEEIKDSVDKTSIWDQHLAGTSDMFGKFHKDIDEFRDNIVQRGGMGDISSGGDDNDGPGMSTFAGQTTDRTVENYAKMMIDSISRGKLEHAIEVWNKSKEIDIEATNRIFEGEKYGKMIADAYLDHAEQNSAPSMRAWWDKLVEVMGTPEGSVYAQHADREMNEVVTCMDNAEVFHPNYIRKYQIEGWARYEYGRDAAAEGHAQCMEQGRIALRKALAIDPNDAKSLRLLETINNSQPKATVTSGCFIATAVYGTPFAEEIDVLRKWRDEFLEASYPGRLFIRTYYSLSPPVADNISESDGKRRIVRTALGPIVKVLKDKYSN